MTGTLPEAVVAEAAQSVLVLAAVATLALAVMATVLHAIGVWTDRARVAHEARWTPLLLDIVTGDAAPDVLAAAVRAHEAEAALSLLVRYSMRLGGEGRVRLAHAAVPFLDAARRQVQSRRRAERAAGLHALGLLGSADEAPRLVAALGDRRPEVALAAARALGQRGGPAAVAPLLTALPRFERVHAAALTSALAQIGPAAADALVAALGDDGLPSASRVVVAEALRQLHHAPAAAPAAAWLAAHAAEAAPDRELTAALLRLLHAVGSPDGDAAGAGIDGAAGSCADVEEAVRPYAELGVTVRW